MSLKLRLLRKLLRPLASAYYRWFFAKPGTLARGLGVAAARWEELSRRGDTPIAAAQWDEQYERGRWDFLTDAQEAVRYGAIAGLAMAAAEPVSLLDVGCGEGLLRRFLPQLEGFRYFGLDVSAAAIDRAHRQALPGDTYEAVDAESYQPRERFAAVVLNESLYYFRDPLGQARKYFECLDPGGVMVVSMFESPRTLAILRRLERDLPLIDSLQLSGGRGTWRLAAFRR